MYLQYVLNKAKINYSFEMNYFWYYSLLTIVTLPWTKKCYHYYIHWVVSARYAKASISARNKSGAYIIIFTGILISYNAQTPPVGVVTVAFLTVGISFHTLVFTAKPTVLHCGYHSWHFLYAILQMEGIIKVHILAIFWWHILLL